MPKKWWTVHARTKAAQMNGVDTAEGHVNFANKGVFNTSDERVVKALEAHKSDAYAVYDEQLTKAYESQSWDVIDDHKGVRVKNLHNYTFGSDDTFEARRTDKDLPIAKIATPNKNKWADFLIKFRLSRFFWFWDTINPKYKREIGVRVFGVEFKKVFDE